MRVNRALFAAESADASTTKDDDEDEDESKLRNLGQKVPPARSGLARDKGRDTPLEVVGTRSRFIRVSASDRSCPLYRLRW
jgi:hypothetical protein